jgi:hypothetical protein
MRLRHSQSEALSRSLLSGGVATFEFARVSADDGRILQA